MAKVDPNAAIVNLGEALKLAIYTEGHPDYPHTDNPEETARVNNTGSGRKPTSRVQRRRATLGKKNQQQALFFRLYTDGDVSGLPKHKCVVTHDVYDALSRQAALDREMAREDGRIRDLYIGSITPKVTPVSKEAPPEIIPEPDLSIFHADKIARLAQTVN